MAVLFAFAARFAYAAETPSWKLAEVRSYSKSVVSQILPISSEAYCDPRSLLSGIRLSSDRGSESNNAAIDEMLEVFGTARSLSKKGCLLDNAVGESANKSPEAEMVWGEEFADLHELQARLNEYVW